MKKYLALFFSICFALKALCIPVRAMDYEFSGPDSGLFAEPTSDHTVYVAVRDDMNIDRSKTAAVAPPRFGSPTFYTLHAGEPLTPNLIQSRSTATVTEVGHFSAAPVLQSSCLTAEALPFMVANNDNSDWTGWTESRYTSVTSDLYYNAGHLGTLSVPAIGLSVKVYQGTDNATLAKGAGHFIESSIWDGNIALAGHNRGVNNHFGKIHNLTSGDTIQFTTQLGTRSYEVYSVSKIAVDDVTVLNDSAANIITLVTCVMDQPSYRWCVQAIERV